MIVLPEAELERLRGLVASQLESSGSTLEFTEFTTHLIPKILRRYPPLQELEEPEGLEEGEEAEPPVLEDMQGGPESAAAFLAKELEKAARSPYFPLAERVFLKRNEDEAFRELMKLLDRNLRIKGIAFRYRLDPEEQYPILQSRIWEAISKWDGRDFRAYCARIVRNHCLDQVTPTRPTSLEDDPHEVRAGRGQTGSTVASRDALSFVMAVIDELEATGRVKALDGVIFALISGGRAVADIVQGFRTSGVPSRFQAAFELLGGTCSEADAVVLRLLLDGLSAEEIETVTGRPAAAVAELAAALGTFSGADDQLLARSLARTGLRAKDMERAQRLTTNAINLCINRIRLKVWMGLADRAYESMRRRKAISSVELAIVQNRCTQSPPAGCRMYKDETCKREADPEDIARRAGLDLDGAALAREMKAFRVRLVEEGLGLVFPDYNACLIERKPIRRNKAAQ